MKTFAKVAELGSFSQAAQALQLPNASVSARVSQLEDRLGVKLFARTTRHVRLTDDGAAYLLTAQRVLADIDEVEDHFKGSQKKPHGRIRVDVPASAGRHLIAPALPDFLRRYPDITVDLGCTDRPVDLIAEGVDCVIRGGNIFDESLVARRLGEFEVITCAAPSYLARYGVPLSPLKLEGHWALNFFSARTGKVMPFDFLIEGQPQTVDLQHQAGTNDADTYLAMAQQGIGIAQLPLTRIVQDIVAAGGLVPILESWRPSSLPIYLIYPRNRHLSARVRAFANWAIELYAGVFNLETAVDR
ncbi:MAG: LysR family transcriptional regulator [Betaproteobacteria bacterium]|nr:LysR family transcriptional regulator [Betaproteobacteria bacterium]